MQIRSLVLVLMALLCAACATPAQRMDEQAVRLGLTRQLLKGTDYSHVVYWHKVIDVPGMLHVYLEGDGTPWLQRSRVAADPTPRNPLMLRLMALDKAPGLYLGRPCYHGQAAIPPCTPLLWTARRYGPEVVDSMAAALRTALAQTEYQGLVFIGYSGGGALAMLLAERFEQTRAVLTIAGNLDPENWAAWHGYSPLHGSLNPASRPPLDPSIVQLHLVGGRDENIPPHLVRLAILQQASARFIVIEDFDHKCCWKTTWINVLESLQAALTAGGVPSFSLMTTATPDR